MSAPVRPATGGGSCSDVKRLLFGHLSVDVNL